MTMLSASQGGAPIWLTPVIAGAAAILAAVATAYATAYAARRKVAELRLANSFELARQYLESARNYSEEVYLPLSISVYRLHNSFLTFKASDETGRLLPAAVFTAQCNDFIEKVDALFIRGATAVLTLRLDETITIFVSFLRESLASTRPVKSTSPLDGIKEAALGTLSELAGIAVGLGALSVVALPGAGSGAGISIGPLLRLGTRRKYGPTYVAAPIESEEFEEQFLVHVNIIKSGIKEVTLGGYKQD